MKMLKYSIDQLRSAIANSTSYRQTMLKLGLAAKGGNYQTVKAVSNRI